MKHMTKEKCIEIRAILETTLTKELKDQGFTFQLGNASYDEDSVKFNGFRITFDDADTQEMKELKRYNDFLVATDRPSFDINKIGTQGTTQYKLVGFKPRATKQPFIVEKLGHKGRFVISESIALRSTMFANSEITGNTNPNNLGTLTLVDAPQPQGEMK